MEIVIVPDCHGRRFWKNGLTYFNNHPDCKMIFLGDYLDPYIAYEGITHDQAYENFLEILEFAKANPLRVILLIGNHDCYLFDDNRECCRHDYENLERNRKLFEDNKELFRYAYKQDNYLFTHAGVSDEWLKWNKKQDLIEEENIIPYLNSNPDEIWQIGPSRGGRDVSSPLWCCWEGDWPWVNNPFNLTQIIGHTWDPIVNTYRELKDKNIYCLDCRECFLLKDDKLEVLENGNNQ